MSPEPKRTPQPPAYEPVEDDAEPTPAPLADEDADNFHDEGAGPDPEAGETEDVEGA